MIRFFVWWNGMSRQKRVGWTLVIVSVGYMLWFLKARVFETGPMISGKEWLYFGLMIGLLMLGTVNIRMAEMRERNQKIMPLIDTSRGSRK